MVKIMNYIGTSGYDYKWWNKQIIPGKAAFYTSGDKLQQYAEHFNYVEINSTFYKVPSLKAVKKWRDSTPDDFSFVVKVNNAMTQYKKLIDFDKRFPEFHDLMSNLGGKLKGYLIQLPPNFTNSGRKSKVDGLTPLERVIKATKVECDVDIFVEFRHSSWFCDEVYAALKGKWHIVFVNAHCFKTMAKGFSPPLKDFEKVVTNKIMFRCHGTWQKHYSGAYSDEDLMLMASLQQEKTIVSFDNTDSFEYESEIQLFPGKLMIEKEAHTTDRIYPHAVSDALRMQMIMN